MKFKIDFFKKLFFFLFFIQQFILIIISCNQSIFGKQKKIEIFFFIDSLNRAKYF